LGSLYFLPDNSYFIVIITFNEEARPTPYYFPMKEFCEEKTGCGEKLADRSGPLRRRSLGGSIAKFFV
jgi:hypothetical protein